MDAMEHRARETTPRASTGVAGLDDVLHGGFPRNRLYLIQGDPGVGKTTLALQFLLDGVGRGETSLYVTLSETEEEIRAVADSHGWLLDGLQLYELAAAEKSLKLDDANTLYHAAEIELHEIVDTVLTQVDSIRPARVVFDSLSELRLLSQTALRYRRQILALKQYFTGRQCTVLLLDDRTSDPSGDLHLQSLSHGVIEIQQLAPEYGSERRRLRIVKLRGSRFRGGYHDLIIHTGGLTVFPRLVAAEHRMEFARDPLASGIENLDAMLGGGIHRGSSTLVIGPAGAGKSSICSQYAVTAAARGENATIFSFDEAMATMLARARSLGMDLESHVQSKRIRVRQIDPAEMAPGQFVQVVRDLVEKDGIRLVVIDSLNGYMNAMPDERFLLLQLHELLMYLNQRGVTTLITMAQHGLIDKMTSSVDVSYLADNLVMLRNFEAGGRVLKAVSVLKKRTGRHENQIRQFSLGKNGVQIGQPLLRFHGVLTGVPTYEGSQDDLLRGEVAAS
jgi:circadian clock protein KaiC